MKQGTGIKQDIFEGEQSLRCESSDNDSVLKDWAWQAKAINSK